MRPPGLVALALPEVVAFDLSIAAQVFGHRDERERYSFTMCAERPGPFPSTTGFSVNVPAGRPSTPAGRRRKTAAWAPRWTGRWPSCTGR
jgi:hypothetical protein